MKLRADGLTEAVAVIAVTAVLVVAAPASLSMVWYPAAAVVVAGYHLVRRDDDSFVGFVLWLWFLSPGVRRYVDFHAGRHDLNPIIIAPALATLLATPRVLVTGRLVRRDVLTALGVALIAYGYATTTGVLLNGLLPAFSAALTVVAPVVLGLFVLVSPARGLRDAILRTFRRALLVLGAYGVTQFFLLPGWDAQWMIDADITSVGRPFPTEVRVFSTLNTAHPFGVVIAVLLVVDLAWGGRRSTAAYAGLALAHMALGLSLVRAAWLGYLGALVVLVRFAAVRLSRYAAAAIVAVALVSSIGTTVYANVSERVSNTVTAGGDDQSLQDRLAFQTELAPRALTDLVGQGLGSAGLSTTLEGGGDAERYRHFDSGLFETVFTLGAVQGMLVLGTLTAASVGTLRRARASAGVQAGYAAGLVVLGIGLLFSNIFDGAMGALLWTLLALSARPSELQQAPGATTRHAAPADGPSLIATRPSVAVTARVRDLR